jgi:hypothetical protein
MINLNISDLIKMEDRKGILLIDYLKLKEIVKKYMKTISLEDVEFDYNSNLMFVKMLIVQWMAGSHG